MLLAATAFGQETTIDQDLPTAALVEQVEPLLLAVTTIEARRAELLESQQSIEAELQALAIEIQAFPSL